VCYYYIKGTIQTPVQRGITMNISTMTRTELEAYAKQLESDAGFHCDYNRMAAELRFSSLESFTHLIFIDLGNMHGLNHAYGMAQADNFIRTLVAELRSRDITVRWGGDEIVVLANTSDIVALCAKIAHIMHSVNLYGVIVWCNADNTLQACVKRCDNVCMREKKRAEQTGEKPGRNENYRLMKTKVKIA
jgi:diguanylate cyclase (GGDEF)-like protein